MNVELGVWGWLYIRLKEFCTSELILTGVPCHNMLVSYSGEEMMLRQNNCHLPKVNKTS